jgi:GNAT superfamily N-acetyltransferase
MLRDLTTDDLPALLQHARTIHAEGVYAAYPMDENRVAYIMQAVIEAPNAFTKAYEIGGEVAGFFLGEVIQDLWIDVQVAVDHLFYVRPESRSSRAGVMLIRAFEEWAAESGADVIRPVVYAGLDNAAVSGVLTRMGYETSGTVHKKEVAGCA